MMKYHKDLQIFDKFFPAGSQDSTNGVEYRKKGF